LSVLAIVFALLCDEDDRQSDASDTKTKVSFKIRSAQAISLEHQASRFIEWF
jgi:hypothetical protein